MLTGRVVRIVGNLYHVENADGEWDITLTGKIRRARDGASKPAAVGDEVEFEPGSPGEGKLLRTLPRRTKLCRAGGSGGRIESVLVANADRVLAVFSSHNPDPDFRAVDRALVMGEAGKMECAIAINKVDLAPPPPEMEAYRAAGYPVFATSAAKGQGLADLRAWLHGKVTALMGPSGVGKSSLLNALEPSWELTTGELSLRIQEGRHTTTWVEMHRLSSGGYVVDTPGIENFGLWGIVAEDLPAYFPETRALQGKCRFRNCGHESEPGCALKAEVEAGRLTKRRYEGYLSILRELRESAPAERW